MTQKQTYQNTDADLEKARTFFKRAEQVEATDNFDYAIDMYLEGLRLAPDALEDGHAPLRKVALIRQGKGGKKPSLKEKMRHRGGATPMEEMLNAEFLLAKDPDNITYAESMLKAAVAGSYTRTAEWIARLIFDANRSYERPSFVTYMLLKDNYVKLERYDKAIEVCRLAAEIRPNDSSLQDEIRDLSAQLTVQRGKYGEEGDFTKSIRDKEKQQKLHEDHSLVKSSDYLQDALGKARKALKEAPASVNNVIRVADALVEMNQEQDFKEAVELLDKCFNETKDIIFKRHKGQLLIKKFRKQIRNAKEKLQADPQNMQLKKELIGLNNQLVKHELAHYKFCVENYPIDLKLKYDYGIRLMVTKQYDQAIPLLQEAQRDPRNRINAMDKTGLCFFMKEWYTDAIEIFQHAIDLCEVKNSKAAKELRYNLARSYEKDNQPEKALQIYRKLAQTDFGFKDVSQRINRLRQILRQ